MYGVHSIKYILILIMLVPFQSAWAVPGDNCWESFTNLCGLLTGNPADMFGAVRQPLESQITGFSLVILWGGLLGIIWFKTENIMLLAIIGVLVSATMTGATTLLPQFIQARGIGLLLLAVSLGILLFQLVRQRISLFT